MATDSIRDQLLLTPFVEALQHDMRERVAMILWWVGQARILSDNQSLLNSGENDGAILLTGRARVEPDGADPLTADAPNLFGEMKQFMPDGERTADVFAEGECTVLHFMWDEFVRATTRYLSLTEQAALKTAILDGASERLRDLYENVERESQA